MNHRSVAVLLLGAIGLSGCYHARIETGLPSSNTVIHEKFAKGWVFGLIPPSTVATAKQCPNGVAVVETQLSFVNQLVGFLTLQIFTPMDIKATCADAKGPARKSSNDVEVPTTASVSEIQAAFETAAEKAVKSGKPVTVRFTEEMTRTAAVN